MSLSIVGTGLGVLLVDSWTILLIGGQAVTFPLLRESTLSLCSDFETKNFGSPREVLICGPWGPLSALFCTLELRITWLVALMFGTLLLPLLLIGLHGFLPSYVGALRNTAGGTLCFTAFQP